MSAVEIPSVITDQMQPIVQAKHRPALQLFGAIATIVSLVAIAAIGFYAGGTAWVERKIEKEISSARDSETARAHDAKQLKEGLASDEFRSRTMEVCRETFAKDSAIAQREHRDYEATLGTHEKRIAALELTIQDVRTTLAAIRTTTESTASDVRELKAARRR